MVSPDVTGSAMMSAAQLDPWRSPRFPTGFKVGLTTDQGSDVYRHIFGHAGGVIGGPGGHAASAYELATDLWQLLGRKHGARAEVLGSLTGQAVGAAMVISVGSERVARRLIKPLICK
jgi:hypothetical protein